MIKKNDYVLCDYNGEPLTGRVINVVGEMADVEVCLSAKRGEETLLDEIQINVKDLQLLKLDNTDIED